MTDSRQLVRVYWLAPLIESMSGAALRWGPADLAATQPGAVHTRCPYGGGRRVRKSLGQLADHADVYAEMLSARVADPRLLGRLRCERVGAAIEPSIF